MQMIELMLKKVKEIKNMIKKIKNLNKKILKTTIKLIKKKNTNKIEHQAIMKLKSQSISQDNLLSKIFICK
jgi:hypothetical protein